ncbi:hypothetical protein [Arthrobacter sp. A2-55]|uniref:hypothetical protein n=1 Tax=Arthrobacter sp. A2-55 TaxID=2897337 RepID=UPI0021CD6F6A|nr:hypothetical protein [Arthrobacter sp. A2-55]MCU6479089.1 hypothetical protein [Arthrobacter sp. A2-55]
MNPEPRPILQFIKDKAAVLGILVFAVAAVIVALVLQGSRPASESAPEPTLSSAPTAALETQSPVRPTEAPTQAATTRPSPTGDSSTAKPTEGPAVGIAPPPGQPTPTYYAGNGPQAPTPKDWTPAATDFAAAWANPAGGKSAWLKRLKPLVTPKLYASFSYTDIRNIPTDTVDSVSLDREDPGVHTFKAYFKDGGYRFDAAAILQPNGSWLVDAIAPPRKN